MDIMPPEPDTNTRVRDTAVAQLTRDDFGYWVYVPGFGAGYLYGVLDYFNDGYPSRTLILVADDGNTAAEPEFTDSDPAGYPKTMATPCVVALHPMGVH